MCERRGCRRLFSEGGRHETVCLDALLLKYERKSPKRTISISGGPETIIKKKKNKTKDSCMDNNEKKKKNTFGGVPKYICSKWSELVGI